MGGTNDEDWKISAMTDDTVVAELLLRLNKPTPEDSHPPPPPPKPALSLEWTVRQRRSKVVTVGHNKKPGPRASPTTPLSWSGAATSNSAGGGGGGSGASGAAFDLGSEESSKPPQRTVHHHHPKPSTTARSMKVSNGGTTSKRPRRKKTLAELKEEEVLLLKERRQLKKELTAIRFNLEKQRVTNEELKRMELDLQSQPANGRGSVISIQDAALSPPTPASSLIPSPLIKSCSEARTELQRSVLPDLNLPFEEDCMTEVSCGAS